MNNSLAVDLDFELTADDINDLCKIEFTTEQLKMLCKNKCYVAMYEDNIYYRFEKKFKQYLKEHKFDEINFSSEKMYQIFKRQKMPKYMNIYNTRYEQRRAKRQEQNLHLNKLHGILYLALNSTPDVAESDTDFDSNESNSIDSDLQKTVLFSCNVFADSDNEDLVNTNDILATQSSISHSQIPPSSQSCIADTRMYPNIGSFNILDIEMEHVGNIRNFVPEPGCIIEIQDTPYSEEIIYQANSEQIADSYSDFSQSCATKPTSTQNEYDED